MTRKDYVLITEAIKVGMLYTTDQTGAGVVAMSLAHALAKDNPRFDRTRFLQELGLKA